TRFAGRIQFRWRPCRAQAAAGSDAVSAPPLSPMEDMMVQNRRRELLRGAVALGAAGVLPAGRPAFAQTTAKRELVVAQGGDISKFDPHFSTSSNDIRWSFNIFDNLTARHADGR